MLLLLLLMFFYDDDRRTCSEFECLFLSVALSAEDRAGLVNALKVRAYIAYPTPFKGHFLGSRKLIRNNFRFSGYGVVILFGESILNTVIFY